TPASSAASRKAAPTGPWSAASIAPPGKAGWPAWRRSHGLRWTISRSGSPAGSPTRIRTADGRPAPAAGGRSGGGTVIRAALPASARSHPGAPGGLAVVKRTGPPSPAPAPPPGRSGLCRRMGRAGPPRRRRRPGGGGVVGRRAVPREQDGRHYVDPPVGALRRQDGGDEELQRGGEVELRMRVRVDPREFPVDPARPADQGGP